MARVSTSHKVLLISEEPKQTELYSRLIREVARCKIDVMTRVENSYDWIARSNYNLVVIDSETRGLSLKDTANSGNEEPTGLTVLEQIKRLSPATSVILLSNQPEIEEAVAAIRVGAEDYFKKPVHPENFRLAVKRGLDKKTVFGENTGASSFLNLLNTCQMISSYVDQKKIFRLIESFLNRELKTSSGSIYVLQEGVPKRFNPNGTSAAEFIEGSDSSDGIGEILDIALHATNALSGMKESGDMFRFIERGQLTPGLFIFRFKCAEAHDYFSVCLSPKKPENIGAFEARLKMLKAQIEVTGKNIEQFLGMQQLVYLDDATGLYNTRYLNFILERQIAEFEETRKSFAVLFMDIDRFKQVNDSRGHLIGTRLLNELGVLLKNLVRDTDTVFRYGGDEFVAVLSDCDLATAKSAAERIRASVENHSFLADPSEGALNLHFTVSIGVALFPEHAKSKSEIIAAADHAMYVAKKSTRNAVTIAEIPATPPLAEVRGLEVRLADVTQISNKSSGKKSGEGNG